MTPQQTYNLSKMVNGVSATLFTAILTVAIIGGVLLAVAGAADWLKGNPRDMEVDVMDVKATKGVKELFLIKRKPMVSRDELCMHWFKNHMPGVMKRHEDAKSAGDPHAWRYIVTLFELHTDGEESWSGMAQLWMSYDEPLPQPDVPHGVEPTDAFQEKALPYMRWPTTEYVIIDGSQYLTAEPLNFGDPYPSTRSGFFRISVLLKAKPDTDYKAFYSHWLNVHVPNVSNIMNWVGGFRYVVSHSMQPEKTPYAGLAELYFHEPGGWDRYRELIKPDGMDEWLDRAGMQVMHGTTDMIGIP